jgi:hypothetical protein
MANILEYRTIWQVRAACCGPVSHAHPSHECGAKALTNSYVSATPILIALVVIIYEGFLSHLRPADPHTQRTIRRVWDGGPLLTGERGP